MLDCIFGNVGKGAREYHLEPNSIAFLQNSKRCAEFENIELRN